jgi:hypothetical protein
MTAARRFEMKNFFSLRKTVGVLAGVGMTALMGGALVSANGGSGGDTSVQPCDPSVQSDCVTVHSPVIYSWVKDSGPAFTDVSGGTPHAVITSTNVPNGFYKVEANGVIDIPLSDATPDDVTPGTALSWSCTLYVVTADTTTAKDQWEVEADDLFDASFFLKAAVNINSSDGFGHFRVDCANNDIGIWSSNSLKIIAVSAGNMIEQAGL